MMILSIASRKKWWSFRTRRCSFIESTLRNYFRLLSAVLFAYRYNCRNWLTNDIFSFVGSPTCWMVFVSSATVLWSSLLTPAADILPSSTFVFHTFSQASPAFDELKVDGIDNTDDLTGPAAGRVWRFFVAVLPELLVLPAFGPIGWVFSCGPISNCTWKSAFGPKRNPMPTRESVPVQIERLLNLFLRDVLKESSSLTHLSWPVVHSNKI